MVQSVLDVPQELILGVAMGLEDADELASRYGIDGARWEKLKAWKPFTDAVAHQRAQLEQTGVTFRIKARALTEDVFEDAYKIARSNDSSLMQKLEFIKIGSKLGDMEPKQAAQVDAGPGFSITINLGNSSPAPKTINMPAQSVDEVKVIEKTESKPKRKGKVKVVSEERVE